MSLEQYKDATRKELWEILQIQVERIAELEDLAQMIIDAESADLRVLPLMYQAWLHKAKALKEQE